MAQRVLKGPLEGSLRAAQCLLEAAGQVGRVRAHVLVFSGSVYFEVLGRLEPTALWAQKGSPWWLSHLLLFTL